VTYQTVVLVANRDGKLRPGMTANATIQIAQQPNALVVPLQALSYRPPAGSIRRRAARTNGGATPSPAGQTPATAGNSPWGANLDATATLAAGGTGLVFVERGGALHPVRVKILALDATSASVTPLRGALAAGDQVVTSDDSSNAPRAQAQSSVFGNGPSTSRRALGGLH